MGNGQTKLSAAEIAELEKTTRLNQEQLQARYKQFMQQNPSGHVSKDTYLRLTTSSCGEATRYMFERIFDVWDKDHDGTVDFKEFITSTSMMLNGDIEQKLRFAFSIYDQDGDGCLTRDEMVKMMTAAFAMVRFNNQSDDDVQVKTPEERVDIIMQETDRNRDGVVTWEEFATACRKNSSLLEALGIAGLQ